MPQVAEGKPSGKVSKVADAPAGGMRKHIGFHARNEEGGKVKRKQHCLTLLHIFAISQISPVFSYKDPPRTERNNTVVLCLNEAKER